MEEKIQGELAQPDLLCSAKKILKSLLGHWAGLIVFVYSKHGSEGGLLG
ncbi:MAG TPA: hypothetical protein VHE99_07170 [Gammaproteobacteria bacterium]|nr:hypothetical protein [Gammaproteobacteria bacterium]